MKPRNGYAYVLILGVLVAVLFFIRFIVWTPTPHMAGALPDQVLLTWSGNPATTQTIQWRTGPKTPMGALTYVREADLDAEDPPPVTMAKADSKRLWLPHTINDPLNYRHTVKLSGLAPNTAYRYAIGLHPEPCPTAVLGWDRFKTAPGSTQDFSFIYMGDVQKGFDAWGRMLQQAHQRHPEVAFHIIAGDLVNRGNIRAEWDQFFYSAGTVYANVPLLPALGNHEYYGLRPRLYLRLFALPENGPHMLDQGQVYSLRYGNALFLTLDSNWPAVLQNAWLERQLAASDADWKIVVQHHPVYSSAPNRDNESIRSNWAPIFDRHHVDLVLQGHDHNYMRTHPMYADQPVSSPAEGTIYIVSNAGAKHYLQTQADYMAVRFPDISTYQVIDISTEPAHRLDYRAYDAAGALRDSFTIVK